MKLKMRMNPAALAATCGLIAALTLAPLSPAATVGSYTNSFNYDYRVYGMPDFDQVRGAGPGSFQLPGSGYMYCAPTSTFNMAAYIANHGFPELTDIGAQNWQSQSLYNAVGLGILNMGNFMGTHPTDGTDGFGFHDGAREYVNARSQAFTVTHQYASGNFAPSQALLTHTAVCGSLVSFGYGRYNVIGAYMGVPIIDRDGGHVVTLSRSTRGNADDRRLWVRDPADEQTNLTQQLTFTNREYGLLHDRAVMTGTTLSTLKYMTEIGVNPGEAGTSNRYIDGYIAIRPKMGYALTQNSTIVTFVTQGILAPGFSAPPQTNFDLGAQAHDVVMNPDMTGLIATLGENAESPIVCIDAATGAIKDLSADLKLASPERVLFGRNRQFYVVEGDTLRCYNLDVDPPVLEAEVVPPAPINAIAYNDTTDELVCLSSAEEAMVTYPSSLAGDGSVTPFPGVATLFDDASIAYNPGEGSILVHPGGGQNLVYQASPLARGEGYAISSISLDGVVDPSNVEADDSGMFYVMGENGAQGYARNDFGRYAPAADAMFNGVVSDGLFRLTHSRTNDSEVPADEQYNIHPDDIMKGGGIADCRFDLNDDRRVDSRDLAAVLAAWGQLGDRADIDGDGVGATDLAGLLAAWGACD